MSDFYVGLICEVSLMTSPRTDRTDWTECEIRGNGVRRDWRIFIPTFPSGIRTREWEVPESSLRKFPDKDQSVAMSDLSDIWIPQELVEVEVIDV